jgi:hypothetical protein
VLKLKFYIEDKKNGNNKDQTTDHLATVALVPSYEQVNKLSQKHEQMKLHLHEWTHLSEWQIDG